MNSWVTIFEEWLAAWLIDYFLLATILLAGAFMVLRSVRQPKGRLVIAWVVLGDLAVLAAVCALPSWTRISLLPASSRAEVATVSVAPGVAARGIANAPRPSQLAEHKTGAAVSQSPAVSKPMATFKLPSVAAMIGIGYLAGMGVTGLWLLWGAIGALRLRRQATPAPGSLRCELAQLVGRARLPRLLLSRRISNAAAMGLLHPTILLQAQLAEHQSVHTLRAMLAHEWAHICNRDLWLLAIERLLRMVLFAHPLYWWLRGRIRADQEAVADAVAASDERPEYAQDLLTFVRLSEGCKPMRSVAAAGILERPTQLSRRIAMLLDETFHVHTSLSSRWKWQAVGVFVVLGGALSCMTLQPARSASNAVAASATQPENPPVRGMKVHTVDAEGRPVGGVKVHASVWSRKPSKANQDYTSDASGVAVVELPKDLYILRIWTSKRGLVPTFTHWEEQWFATGGSAPEEVTITLKKGATIGGSVKNEEGQPIAGARIGVAAFGVDERKQTVDSIWLAEGEDACVTGTNGRWTLDNIPEGDPELTISVTHPDYVSDLTWGGLQKKQHVTTASLRDQTATVVMQRGTSLTGRVTDPQGKGIAGAVVVWGDNPFFETGSHQEHQQEVRTDAKGVYRLQALPPMPLTVTVIAPGWMPQLKKTTIAPDSPKLDFRLTKGNALRLRFVDSSGKPIPDVAVIIDGWRGCKSLYNEKHPIVLETQIPRSADKNGVFEWVWAPDDAVHYQFWKEGYRAMSKSIVAKDTEQTIHLDRE